VGVKPYIEKTIGPEGIKVAILGIGNHRVPNYELPSNIPGLTFSNPLTKAQELSSLLRSTNDVIIALTHIGFTENPSSVEVDTNVDTNLAATTNGIDAIIGAHSHTDPSKQTAYSGIYKYLPSIVPNPDGKPVIINQAYRYNNTLGEIVMGLRVKAGGGYEVVSETGRYLSVVMTTAEDPATKAIVDPYVAALNTYNNKTIGKTTAPIDTMQAFTQETNGANLQADASVYELETKNGIPVDFHLSGAMTNKLVATTATPASPVTLMISDMFAAMPYENSLVVIGMNGPQLKAVLERAYRNYYYYKYVPGYGGYSYYTTCMLDTNFGNQIKYNDLSPALPNGNNVVSLNIGGVDVDFTDAAKYYNVSTVNYLAAGSCNFNDGGITLWPLNQIVADTQYYVRDAVIDYITFNGTVSPAIEGRLSFITDAAGPVITINAPTAKTYGPADSLTLDFSAIDAVSGVKSIEAKLDGTVVTNGQVIVLNTLSQGDHTLMVNAADNAGNTSSQSVTFSYDSVAPVITIKAPVAKYYGPADTLTLDFSAIDAVSGVKSIEAKLDGTVVTNGQVIVLNTLSQGDHTVVVKSVDNIGNETTKSVTFGYDSIAPVITINSPKAQTYLHPFLLWLNFKAVDAGSGLQNIGAVIDSTPVKNNQFVDLHKLSLGNHTLVVTATDNVSNVSTRSVTFSVTASIPSLEASVLRLVLEGKIDSKGCFSHSGDRGDRSCVQKDLLAELKAAQNDLERGRKTNAIGHLNNFISVVQHNGTHIRPEAANLLITDAQWVIGKLK
jgi:2',3'-cyclic-nucleotide 2'-phosphodiesterase (5'-nucleotidase family)